MRILARDHRREFHRLGERFFGDMRRKAQRLRLDAIEFAVGVDHLAQHVVGNLGAPQRHAGDIGDKAPAHFHDRDARIGMNDADIGGGHDLAARAKGDAVYRRNHRHRQFAPAPGGILRVVGKAARPFGEPAASAACARIALAAEAGEIESGAKGAPLARQDDDAQPRGRLELVDRRRKRLPHRAVERVHLVGADQADVGDAVVEHGDRNTVLHGESSQAFKSAASTSGSWSLPKYISSPSTNIDGEP